MPTPKDNILYEKANLPPFKKEYVISAYAKRQAKKYGVEIRPSTNKKKKIDVFKNGEKIASIGATGYKDYAIYLKENGKEYADKRRELYKIRHKKDLNVEGSNGWWANVILW